MHAVLERGKKSLEVFLCQFPFNDFFSACFIYHNLHLINCYVTVLVCIDTLSEVLLKIFLRSELVLQVSSDFN